MEFTPPRPQFFVWTFFKICPFLTRLQICPWKTFSETSQHRWYSKAGSNKYWCFTRVWRLKIQGENFPTLFKRPWHKSIIFCWVPTAPSNLSPATFPPGFPPEVKAVQILDLRAWPIKLKAGWVRRTTSLPRGWAMERGPPFHPLRSRKNG